MVFLPEDVFNKRFTATQFRRGYDEREVDEFLDVVLVEMRRLNSDNTDLRLRLKACRSDKGAVAPPAREMLAAAMLFAHRTARDTARIG